MKRQYKIKSLEVKQTWFPIPDLPPWFIQQLLLECILCAKYGTDKSNMIAVLMELTLYEE